MDSSFKLRSLGSALRAIGSSKAGAGAASPDSASVYFSTQCPNIQIMNFGLADINNQILPGGIPVHSVFGFITPDPWLDRPPSHHLEPDFETDGGPTHIANLIGIGFGSHGILIEDSALLIITGSHLLKGTSALSIATSHAMWPSLLTQEPAAEPAIEEKSIPLKIAWRYNTLKDKPNKRPEPLPKQTSVKNSMLHLNWTTPIASDNALMEKFQERSRVISLSHVEDMEQIKTEIQDFFSFIKAKKLETGRILIEDPLSPFSKLDGEGELLEILAFLKDKSTETSAATILLLPNRNTFSRIFHFLDGFVEVNYCPKTLVQKHTSSPQALIKWKKPLRLSNLTYWSPPTSIGGVWHVSLSRRKAVALVPVSLPVDDDDDDSSKSFASYCSLGGQSW